MKCQLITQEEQKVRDKLNKIDEQNRILSDSKKDLEKKDEEVKYLKFEIENQKNKIFEGENIIESNKQVIAYLNKQLNDNAPYRNFSNIPKSTIPSSTLPNPNYSGSFTKQMNNNNLESQNNPLVSHDTFNYNNKFGKTLGGDNQLGGTQITGLGQGGMSFGQTQTSNVSVSIVF